MTILQTTTLTDADTDFVPKPFPRVYAPARPTSFAGILAEIDQRRDEIRDDLKRYGAVLFRDTGAAGFDDFQRTMDAIGIEPSTPGQYFGESLRGQVSGNSLDVTHVERDDVVMPHTEACYWLRQPKHIAFYCVEADDRWGETPLFDCAAIAAGLPPDLREKLRHAQVLFEFIFQSAEQGRQLNETQLVNTWQDSFGTDDRSRVEALLDHDGITRQWLDDGGLLVGSMFDMMSPHPDTGELCMRGIRFPTNASHRYMLKTFVEPRIGKKAYLTKNALFFRLPPRFDLSARDPRRYYWTERMPGLDLGEDDKARMVETYFRHCSIARWRKGDIMLIDNLRTGHARLNVGPNRRIVIYIGRYVDVDELFAQEAT